MTNIWALLLSTDSLIAGVALGPLVSARDRWLLAALFGLFDGLGTLLGVTAVPPSAQVAADLIPLAIAAYGIYLIGVSMWARGKVGKPLIYLTPVLLAVDNLFSGGPDGQAALTVSDLVAATVISAALALAGLWFGSFLASATGLRPERLAGAGLLVAAAAVLIT
ncbi:MAG TPA: hypothetical protein VII33_18145 [Nakamurella sp.]